MTLLAAVAAGARVRAGGAAPDLVPASIVVTPATASLAPTETQQLTAVVYNAALEDITASHTVVWSSGTPAAATVSSSGLVTAVADGSATITAYPTGYPLVTGTTAVTVETASASALIDLSGETYPHAMRVAVGPQIALYSGDAVADAYDAEIHTGRLAGQTVTDWLTVMRDYHLDLWTPIAGTVAVTNGSATVTGTGTNWASLPFGGAQAGLPVRIRRGSTVLDYRWLRQTADNASTTIAHPQYGPFYADNLVWAHATESGLEMDWCDASSSAQYNSQYYDRVATGYRHAYRLRAYDAVAGDALLTLCDEAADAWIDWYSQTGGMYLGETTNGDGWGHPPRAAGFEGMMIRALRGRTALLPYLHAMASGHFGTWVYARRLDIEVLYDMRDPGYAVSAVAMSLAAMTSKADKDALMATVVAGWPYITNTQEPSGHWEMVISWASDRLSQAFTNVHIMHGMQRLLQAIREDPDLAADYASFADSVEATFLLGADGIISSSILSGEFAIPWRGTRYYDSLTGAYAVESDIPELVGELVRDYGFDAGYVPGGYAATPYNPAAHDGEVSVVRQAGSMMASVLGYAYALTGTPAYLTAAEDLFDAAFVGTDGIRAQYAQYTATMDNSSQKFWNESHRRTSEYLAFRQGVSGYGDVALTPDLVTFDTLAEQIVFGPLVATGHEDITEPNFDDELTGQALTRYTTLMGYANAVWTTAASAGTVTVTNGSATILGAGGADFTGMTNSRIRIQVGGSWYYYRILAVVSATEATIKAVNNWPSSTTATPWTGATTADCDWQHYSSSQGDAFDGAYYYDTARVLYQLYHRTGNTTYRDYARNLTDAWWQMPNFSEGQATGSATYSDGWDHSPRTSNLGGLIMRALDGRPEMWPYLRGYVHGQLFTWAYRKSSRAVADGVPGATGATAIQGDTRDSGYMCLYAAWMAVCDPDATWRDTFLQRAVDAQIGYHIEHQTADGSWRWSLDPGVWAIDAPVGQPFINAIMLCGLVDLARILRLDERGADYADDLATIEAAIRTGALGALWGGYIDTGAGTIRGVTYFESPTAKWTSSFTDSYGRTAVANVTLVEDVYRQDPGAVSDLYPSTRQGIAECLPIMYAAAMFAATTTERDDFIAKGDEMANSAHRYTDTGGDGYRALVNDSVKNWNQHYQDGQRGWARRYLALNAFGEVA